MCDNLCWRSTTKQNFNSFGPVVCELWLIFLEILTLWGLEERGKKRREKKCVFWHIFSHISGITVLIGLKFSVIAGFSQRVPHTKFQPLRLQDAEDIGWCGWRGNWCFWAGTQCTALDRSALTSVLPHRAELKVTHDWRFLFTGISKYISEKSENELCGNGETMYINVAIGIVAQYAMFFFKT